MPEEEMKQDDGTVKEIVSMIMELPKEVQAEIYDQLGTKLADSAKAETETPEFEQESQQDIAKMFIQ